MERLQRYKSTINHLSFSCDTIIIPTHIDHFESTDQFVLNLAIDDVLAFGVTADAPVQLLDIEQQNQKRLQQFRTEWETLNDAVSHGLYESKTSKNERKRNASKVSPTVYGHFIRIAIVQFICISFQMQELEAKMRTISRLKIQC